MEPTLSSSYLIRHLGPNGAILNGVESEVEGVTCIIDGIFEYKVICLPYRTFEEEPIEGFDFLIRDSWE